MTYRDELAQAHERIEHLEAELREERAKATVPPARARGPSMRGVAVVMAIGILVGAGAGVLALRAPPRGPLMLEPVDKVLRDPRRYEGTRMRVQGELVAGTTKRGGDPCEMRFFVKNDSLMLPVHMKSCIVPEAYRDETGILVTAEGTLGSDGVFEAEQILVKWMYPFPGMK